MFKKLFHSFLGLSKTRLMRYIAGEVYVIINDIVVNRIVNNTNILTTE